MRAYRALAVVIALFLVCEHSSACERALKLERDWMAGYKPSCSAFVGEFGKCNWAPWIKDDDSSCTFYEYVNQAPGGLKAYLTYWENDATPATGHKVQILGAKYFDPVSQEVGYYFDDGCCHFVGVVAVKACAERGSGWEPCVSNHEIGHQFQNTAHCSSNLCVMYDDGPTTPTAFCTTGMNHRNWVSTHSP